MLDDLVDPEVAVAAAATAAVLSSRVRGWLHRGAVYGVAGALVAGDALSALGRGLARGVRERVAEIPTSVEPDAQHASDTSASQADAATPADMREPDQPPQTGRTEEYTGGPSEYHGSSGAPT